jgi:preprotein translocase subunit SecB
MNLALAGIILEEMKFGHVGNFLARVPQATPAQQPALIQVEILKGAEPDRAAVRLRVSSQPDHPDYSFALSYLVLFQLSGDPIADLDQRLAATGAMMLVPYVRELLSNVSGRGRFGAVWMHPIDVSSLIPQQVKQRAVGARRKVRKKKPSKR